jgi:iron complex transport system ATP-binding protein
VTADAVRFDGVTVWRSAGGVRRAIVDDVDWRVGRGERWGIAGPNGAGKTTLLRIASAQLRPSRGSAEILGGRLGAVSMPELRRRIGLVEPALARRFYPEQRAIDVVLTGPSGSILLAQEPGVGEIARARDLLEEVGAGGLELRTFASCSEGERARILLARALLADGELLVLDEPAAGLDLGGRELLLAAFDGAIRERPELTTLTVTHHLEELPPSTTHALLLRDGAVVAAGPLEQALTDDALSRAYGLPLRVERSDGRIFVRAGRRQPPTRPGSKFAISDPEIC